MTRIVCLLCLFALLGCSKEAKQDKPASSATSETTQPKSTTSDDKPVFSEGSLLHEGMSACVVIFPEAQQKEEWLSLIRLKGASDTDRLPRIPLASSNTMTLLNIPPGMYQISASAWLRKSPPYTGGISDSVNLTPGELLILRAPPLPNEDITPDHYKLDVVGRKTWTVAAPQQLPPFIAETAKAIRG
ncbi:MAG: hypothetical protein H6508_00510 [Calditrichaeota bacterium]|nr:hypothetical protein [Calditrichota bacterium]MCB9365655.1 hypothetical protein [Calditrichota bacterium]